MIRALALLALLIPAIAPTRAEAQPRFPPAVQAKLDALKDEPGIQQAQAAALAFFNVDPDSVEGMRSRAAIKGLMPQLEARYRQNRSDLAIESRNVLVDEENFLYDDVAGTVHEFSVGARWNLPLLVFNAEVLDVGSLAVLQEGVLKEVTRLYFTRRRLQIDQILNPSDDPASALSKELRIAELTSTLDAMTGNLFSEAEARRARLERRSGATP